MSFLVDANILSEPTKPRPNPKVVAWLNAHEKDLFIDSLVLGELAIGILALARGRKRAQLEHWFEWLADHIECLPWDAATARRWAQLVVNMRAKGITLPVLDSMIAATALAHGVTLATHNVRDFQKAGVLVFDPFV